MDPTLLEYFDPIKADPEAAAWFLSQGYLKKEQCDSVLAKSNPQQRTYQLITLLSSVKNGKQAVKRYISERGQATAQPNVIQPDIGSYGHFLEDATVNGTMDKDQSFRKLVRDVSVSCQTAQELPEKLLLALTAFLGDEMYLDVWLQTEQSALYDKVAAIACKIRGGFYLYAVVGGKEVNSFDEEKVSEWLKAFVLQQRTKVFDDKLAVQGATKQFGGTWLLSRSKPGTLVIQSTDKTKASATFTTSKMNYVARQYQDKNATPYVVTPLKSKPPK